MTSTQSARTIAADITDLKANLLQEAHNVFNAGSGMLIELTITNIALIGHERIDFQPGFIVLTGETGAGKSIIIGALSLLLGTRASPSVIRSGDEKATVEAVFELSSHSPAIQLLLELGIEPDENMIILRREIQVKGRNRCFINDTAVTVQAMSAVLEHLLVIHGQHQQQVLLDVEQHLNLLDLFGRLQSERDLFEEKFNLLLARIQQLQKLRTKEQELLQRQDLIRYQLTEIKQAALEPGEEDELIREEKILASAHRYIELLQSAYEILYEQDLSLLSSLAQVGTTIEQLKEIDSGIVATQDVFVTAYYQLQDVAETLRNLRDRVDIDPQRLETVVQRREEIRRLKKKYGNSVEAVLLYRDRIQSDLDEADSFEIVTADLEREITSIYHDLFKAGEALSAKRREVAADFSDRMVAELHELGMPSVRFDVSFTPLPRDEQTMTLPLPFGPDGFERAEFLISPNLGEPLKPVVDIASGGEISRIMLAIRGLIVDLDMIPTIVFDEVDVGIGGNIARAVGMKIRKIARNRQVLCITHLPQIASLARNHYLVTKQVDEGRTTTKITRLSDEDRVSEIARMLDGESTSDLSKDHAVQLLTTQLEDRQ